MGAIGFAAYWIGSMVFQVAMLPAIDAGYWEELDKDASRTGKFSNDLDKDPLPDDFNDWTYLGLPTLDIGI